MWIEQKVDGIAGPARIGRVTYSKTGRSLTYRNQQFGRLGRKGFKANYVDLATGEQYWISGCHTDGRDALYSTTVEIDEDVRLEYWTKIRNKPEQSHVSSMPAPGKHPS